MTIALASNVGRERVLMRGWRAGVWVVAFCAFAAACGGGSESAGDGAGGGDGVLATIEPISADVTVQRGGASAFEPVQGTEDLGQGDKVRTDATGLGEIVFFDGSWQRIDAGTEVALTELVDIEDGQVVRTGLDVGRAWQRVESLTTEDDAYEVDTPVAVASVRGTEFSIDCRGEPIVCTFSVVGGAVELAVSGGTSVTLSAGQTLAVSQSEPIGTPQTVGVDQLRQDPWIARNLALDQSDPPAAPGGAQIDESPGATGEFAVEANAICETAGAQSAAVDGDADTIAAQQAVVLDGALDQLEELDPPAEIADQFQLMIGSYRQRTALVRQALDAPAEERQGLVTDLVETTATGAAVARDLDLESCIVRSA
jgi:hypothetical protein